MEEPVILVVEDEAFVRDLIRYILETAGYAVRTASRPFKSLARSRPPSISW